jgi:hypothetical protein
MTKRSACRNQLLNEVEGAEDAGTSRAFVGSASPTQRCTCQFGVLVARNRYFPPPIVLVNRDRIASSSWVRNATIGRFIYHTSIGRHSGQGFRDAQGQMRR